MQKVGAHHSWARYDSYSWRGKGLENNDSALPDGIQRRRSEEEDDSESRMKTEQGPDQGGKLKTEGGKKNLKSLFTPSWEDTSEKKRN